MRTIAMPSATLCVWRQAAEAKLEILRVYRENGTEPPPAPASELQATTEALIELLDEIDRLRASKLIDSLTPVVRGAFTESELIDAAKQALGKAETDYRGSGATGLFQYMPGQAARDAMWRLASIATDENHPWREAARGIWRECYRGALPGQQAEPLCRARVARALDWPMVDLPCIESIEKPGSCSFCRNPMQNRASNSKT